MIKLSTVNNNTMICIELIVLSIFVIHFVSISPGNPAKSFEISPGILFSKLFGNPVV